MQSMEVSQEFILIYKMEALALQDVGICIESPDTQRVAARFSSEKKISKHMDNNKEMFLLCAPGAISLVYHQIHTAISTM